MIPVLEKKNSLKMVWAAAVLAAITAAVYWQVRHFTFLHYDDNQYVFENPYIRGGLNLQSLRWAFSAGLLFQNIHCDYWQPLTFISRALDIQLFGLNPAAHHLMNLFFHVCNTLLLFLLLARMTRAPWKSFFAALIFAVHPVQIEAVAWVTARKDMLSGFFALLCLTFYTSSREKNSKALYGFSLFFYLCATLSKPLFMLPFFLLLLDFWPLEKKPFTAGKIPFFLVGAVGLILFKSPIMSLPVSVARFTERTLAAYPDYLRTFFWPVKVGIYGPVAGFSLPPAQGTLAAFLLAVVCYFVLRFAKKLPFLFTGWFWFLVGLGPVVWGEWTADRFLYLPMIGLIIAVIWGAEKLLEKIPHGHKAGFFLACVAVILLIFSNSRQIGYWRNNEELFMRALEINPRNFVAHNNLGVVLMREGDIQDARGHFEQAHELNPDYLAQIGLGLIAEREGNIGGAIAYYKEGIRLHPENPIVYFNLAGIYYKMGNLKESERLYREALKRDPLFYGPYTGLGNIAATKGHWKEAEEYFLQSLQIKPDSPEAQFSLMEMRKKLNEDI